MRGAVEVNHRKNAGCVRTEYFFPFFVILLTSAILADFCFSFFIFFFLN